MIKVNVGSQIGATADEAIDLILNSEREARTDIGETRARYCEQ
jgi:hypothetical protein